MNDNHLSNADCDDCPPQFLRRSNSEFLCSLSKGSLINCNTAICPYGDHGTSLSSCPPGFITSGGNCVESCSSPPDGDICVPGLGAITCEEGFYANSANTVCLPCPTGSVCIDGKKNDCTGNDYSSKEYSSGTECETCPAGAECSNEGILQYCNEGEYPDNQSRCRPCTAEKRCDPVTGQAGNDKICDGPNEYHDIYSPITTCETCPDGYTCSDGNKQLCPDNMHSENGDDCEGWNVVLIGKNNNCPSGMYPIKDTAKCEPCPAGFSCATDSFTLSACDPYVEYSQYGIATCEACPTDHVCPINGLPYRCRYGQEIENHRCIDKISSITYPTCPTGWECLDGTTTPIKPCEPGTYSLNGECEECSEGNYCPYPEMGEQLSCADGYYSPNTKMTECFPCPAGYSCEDKTAATSCPVGKYSLVMTAECIDCPAGFYCPNKENKQVLPCLRGTYSGANAISCLTCTAGNYCANGVQTSCSDGYYSLDEASFCLPCPAGFNCQVDGISKCNAGSYSDPFKYSSTNVCTLCPEGYYCPSNAKFGEEYIVICPQGYHCPEGSTFPEMCNAGTYGFGIGLTAQSDCVDCPNGYFCPEGTPGFPNEEYICPLGHYCNPSSSNPTVCPVGTYGDQFGLTSEAECRPCEQGRECAAGSTTPGQPCPVGKFCPADFNRRRGSSGILCPPGTYNKGTGAADIDKCVPCPAGHYCCDATQPDQWEPSSAADAFTTCTGGVSSPTSCRIGSYQSRSGQFTCDLCPTGKKCTVTGLQAPDAACEYGKFCMVGTGLTGTSCPKGTFTDHSNSTSMDDCEACPAGYYCDNNLGSTWMVPDQLPEKCQAGYYCMEGTPASDTYSCPKGTDGTDLLMATASVNCTICTAGLYCPESTGSPGKLATTCPAGHFCPEGTGGEDDDDVDIPACPAGTFLTETGKSRVEDCLKCLTGSFCDQGVDTPTGCDPGTFSADDGIGSQSDCERCPAGYKCDIVGTIVPSPCGTGKFSNFGASECDDCLKGHYCNLNTTTYDAMNFYNICPEGTDCNREGTNHIPDLINDACPIGYWCAKGDVKAYQSEPQPCPPGTYGQRYGLTNKYECDKCPAGYYCEESGITCNTLAYGSGGCDGVKVCPKGMYCEQGASVPMPCGPGFYRSLTTTQAAVNQTSCSLCRSGYYCDTYGTHDDDTDTSSPEYIKSCPKGYYCPPGSILPEPCDVGSYGNDTNFRSSFECILCDPTTYCPTRGMEATGELCAAGYYCSIGAKSKNPRDGITGNICPKGAYCTAGVSEPILCSSGKSTLFDGAESVADCKDCYPGYYCPGSVGSDSLATALARLPCEPGKYCPPASPGGQDCPEGSYCPQEQLEDGSYVGAIHPRPCPPGTFSGKPNRSQCEDCIAGTFCPLPGMTKGLTCPVGYYCPGGATEPSACSRGHYNDLTASTAISDCKQCDIGFYCDSAGMANGIECPDGYNCYEQGIVNPLLEEVCDAVGVCTNKYACEKGKHCQSGVEIPQDCPAGKYNPRLYGRDVTDCLECTPGKACTQQGLPEPDADCDTKFYCTGGAARSSGTGDGPIQVCQSGFYCPVGSPDQIPCSRTTYSENAPSSECTICTDGYYCPGYLETNNINADRLICPPGQYCGAELYEGMRCPKGTFSNTDGINSTQSCSQCPAGSYCPQPGATSVLDSCDAGYICDGAAISKNPNSESELNNANANAANGLCPVGYYCPAGTVEALPCPLGTFGSVAGLEEKSDCSDCPGGYFCDEEGLTWERISDANQLKDDYKCDAGYYCESGCRTSAPSSSNVCVLSGGRCPKGHKCPKGSTLPIPCENGSQSEQGSSECSPCLAGFQCENGETQTCPRGYYCEEGTNPIACEPGTYNNQRGNSTKAACVLCPAGFYCPKPGMTSGTSNSCHAGYYCNEGSTVGKPNDPTIGMPCPIGSYCPERSSKPLDCPRGHYCDKVGTTDVEKDTNLCAAGYFCDVKSTSATPGPDAENLIFCAAGHFCKEGAEGEEPCKAGTFGPPDMVGLRSQAECLNCPKGKVCNGDGKTEPADCQEGNYCQCDSNDVCESIECAAGFQCPTGSKSQLPCPFGTYQPDSGKGSCITCPAGSYCTITDDGIQIIGAANPEICPTGHYCPRGSGFKIPCPPGSYNDDTGMKDLKCKPCPEGFYCPDPGLAIYPDDSLKCAPGYHCIGGAAYPNQADGTYGELCPLGYYCPEGLKIPCDAGYYGTSEGLEDQFGSNGCSLCPKGFDCSENSNSVVTDLLDHKCEAGYTCPNEGTGTGGNTKIECLSEGKYCPSGMFVEQDCPAGSWNDAATSPDVHTSCGLCPEGFVCNGQEKKICPIGFYCPSGSSETTAIGCPAGTYSPKSIADDTDASGLTRLSQCEPCPSGKYCPFLTSWSQLENLDCYDGFDCQIGSITPSPELICPKGYYCPKGIKTACPIGTFLTTTGGRAETDCIMCTGGYFCDTEGMETAPEAPEHGDTYKCKAGYFCFAGATEYEPSEDINDPKNFGICPPGYICPVDGIAEPTGCEDGYYQSETGQIECTEYCPAGYLCSGAKSQYDNTDECPPGYYCENDGTTWKTLEPCRKGTYRSASLNSPADSEDDCEPCPPGKFCAWGGVSEDMTTTDSYCEGGFYCSNENDGSWTARPYCNENLNENFLATFCDNGKLFGGLCPIGSACPRGVSDIDSTVCPENRFCPYHGLDNATVEDTEFYCASGYNCAGGARTSTPNERYNTDEEEFGNICREGKYCESGMGEIVCDDFYYNPQNGLTNNGACRECPPGRLCEEGFEVASCEGGRYCSRATPSTACAIGHKCPEGIVMQVPCNKGSYQDQPEESECKDCLVNMYCDGVTDLSDPIIIDPIIIPVPCPDGYECSEKSERPYDTPCEPGNVGTGDNVSPCEICPLGRYCPNFGMSSADMDNEVFHCSSGYYCDNGSISPFGQTDLNNNNNECSPGYYCPTGSDKQELCPTGYFRNVTRGGEMDDCQPCPGGYTCIGSGLSTPTSCPIGNWCPPPNYCDTSGIFLCSSDYSPGVNIICPTFHYCPSGTVYPVPCPHGTYLEAGQTGQSECLECPNTGGICKDGQYTENCIQDRGNYCLDGTAFPCPAGTYTDKTDLTSLAGCEECPAGYYCDSSGTIVPRECSAGFICTTESLTATPDASKSDNTQVLNVKGYRCPAGYYCLSGNEEETSCPEGTYRSIEQGESESDCLLCPTGKYCDAAESSAGTGDCETGYYCAFGATSATPSLTDTDNGYYGPCLEGHYCQNSIMLKCPAGKYQDSPLQTSCLDCPAKSYCEEGTITPIPCPDGAYCSSRREKPEFCNIGYYMEVGVAPSDSQVDCRPCKPGYSCPKIGMTEDDMELCDPGYYCPEQSTSKRQQKCQAGYYCPSGGQSVPIQCDAGSSCTRAGLEAPNEGCYPGYYCPVGSSSPMEQECEKGYYCSENVSEPTPCPIGTYQPFVSQWSDDTCQPCLPGYYCSQAGMANAPSNDQSCQEGFYCPPGSQSPVEEKCPLGYECVEQSGFPSPCPDGKYADRLGLSECEECPAGSYCIRDKLNGTGVIYPIECPEGFYCPDNNPFKRPIPCPIGSIGKDAGNEDEFDCEICDEGHFCTGHGLVEATAECYAGYYCPDNRDSFNDASNGMPNDYECPNNTYCPQGSSEPIECPDGTYRPSSYLGISRESCQPCPPGKYCEAGQNPKECSAGFICLWGASQSDPNDDTGYECPEGHFCPQGELAKIPCEAGTYVDFNGATSQGECDSCEAGFFCPIGSSNTTKYLCLAGFYCPSGSSVGNPLNTTCPVGYQCPAGSTEKEPCNPGTYSDIIGASVCTPCPAGFFCQGTENDLEHIDICPAGSYCEANSDDHKLCPPGTFSLVNGAKSLSECTLCPAGYYCLSGTSALTDANLCQEGFYCPTGTDTSSPVDTRCPANYQCPQGSSNMAECDVGYYSNNVGLAECKPCPPGNHCPRVASQITQLTGCGEGTYCPANSARETNCNIGTFNEQQNSTSQEACQMCEEGFYCDQIANGNKQICDSGFHCISGSYTARPGCIDKKAGRGEVCPIGYVCPDGLINTCDPGLMCSKFGETASTTLLECPAGYYCPEGTTVELTKLISESGINLEFLEEGPTSCNLENTGVYCPANVFEPVPCPPGEWFMSTGSSDSGIKENKCIPCPEGRACTMTGIYNPEEAINCSPGYYCYQGSATTKPDDLSLQGGPCCENNYCESGSKAEYPCNPGTYQSNKLQSSCNECRSGKYCPGKPLVDSSVYDGESCNGYSCNCIEGHYCPSSSISPIPCPVGTYGRDGTTSYNKVENCITCDAGHFCDTEGLVQMDIINQTCQEGYYCNGGSTSSTPNDEPILSENGKWINNAKCPLGYYCPSASKEPQPCPKGTIGIETGIVAKSLDASMREYEKSCIPCPPGLYCPYTSISVSDPADNGPIECPETYYCPSGSESFTQLCSQGHYCPKGTPAEISCHYGYYQSEVGHSTCELCPVGYYCNAPNGTIFPERCPTGHYCSEKGTINPTPCLPGTYNPTSEPSNEPISKEFCLPCREGYYCAKSGLSEPSNTCEPGYMCRANAAVKDPELDEYGNGPCPAGFYCENNLNDPKTLNPVKCPIGRYNPSSHGKDKNDCMPCPAGYACPTGDTMEPCNPGSYCPNNDVISSTSGYICPESHYCPSGTADPIPCPLGYYQNQQGSVSCNLCEAGYFCLKEENGIIDKQTCLPKFYCPEGSALPTKCPPGTYVIPGEDTGLQKKEDCRACPMGNFCRDGAIQGACMSGYLCYSGADAPNPKYGNNLTIDPTLDNLGNIVFDTYKDGLPYECSSGDVCAGPCPAGFYCFENVFSELSDIQPCLENTIRDVSGGMSPDDCQTCPPGVHCKKGDGFKHPCEPGFYCPPWYLNQVQSNIFGNITVQFNDALLYVYPSPGPQPCPIYTYRDTSGGISIDDCPFCPAGYYCNVQNISDIEEYPCKPGFYCSGQGLPPRKCPAGRMAPVGHLAKSIDDCLKCVAGRYCPDPIGDLLNINGTVCPIGYECPEGNRVALKCEAGYYCNELGMSKGKLCPPGYFCEEGTYELEHICKFPFYCPAGSSYPQPCPLGFSPEFPDGDNNRTNVVEFCKSCPAGTYRANFNQTECITCEPGYYCPKETGDYTQNSCPEGNACPPGDPAAPFVCPKGTYAFGTGNALCNQCLPNTYSSSVASTSCQNCGTASFSNGGEPFCTCVSDTRIFQETDSSCICKPRYAFSNDGIQDDSEFDSDGDCIEQLAPRCDQLSSTNQKCIDGCEDDYFFDVNYGICVPLNYELEPSTCCLRIELQYNVIQNNYDVSEIDDETGKSDTIDFDSNDVFGLDDVRKKLGDIFTIQQVVFNDNKIMGIRDIKTARRYRRQSGTAETQIENPAICLSVGDAVLFDISVNQFNRSESEYPIYMQSSTLNSNQNFDYGDFRILRYYVTKTNLQIRQFLYSFAEEGDYVFQSSINEDTIAIISVRIQCAINATPVQTVSTAALLNNGVTQMEATLEPNWPLIIGLSSGFAIIIILIILCVLCLDPFKWEVFSTKRFQVKYQELADPLLPAKMIKSGESNSTNIKSFQPSSNELEDFNVKHFVDKLRDQRFYIANQIKASNNLLDSFGAQMRNETKNLSDQITKLSLENMRLDNFETQTEVVQNGIVNVNAEIRRVDQLSLEEDNLFKTMQDVLNKLHGGRLIIADDEIEKAKEAYKNAKNAKHLPLLKEKSTLHSEPVIDTINQNQADIVKELKILVDAASVPESVKNGVILGSNIDVDDFLSRQEMEHNQWDTQMLEQREKQKWHLRNRLKNRLHPKYSEEILNEQIALTELELRKEALIDDKENEYNNSVQAKEFANDRNNFLSNKLDKINVTSEVKTNFMQAIDSEKINSDTDDECNKLIDDIRKHYRKRKIKQLETLKSIHQAELAELTSTSDLDIELVLRRHGLETDATEAQLEQELNIVLDNIKQEAGIKKDNQFDENVQNQANKQLSPAVAVEFIRAYKENINEFQLKKNAEKLRQQHLLEEKRKQRLLSKNNDISTKIQKMYEHETGKIYQAQDTNYDSYVNINGINSTIIKAKEKDGNLQAELDKKQRELDNEISDRERRDIEAFDADCTRQYEQLEMDLEEKKLTLIRENKDHDIDIIMDQFNQQQDQILLNLQTDNIRRRTMLEAALRKRRRQQLISNSNAGEVTKQTQEVENKKEMESVKKTNIQKSELEVIKAGIQENGGDDAIKIVKSVLDARHQEELAELEDFYGIEREQLLIDCAEEDRIKVLSDWEYRMNMDVVKLRQVHYDELIKYLEQVSPKTAESIKANNEKREQKKIEIEKYQQELDKNFKQEREQWENEQNLIIEKKLRTKEEEFEAELQKELNVLENLIVPENTMQIMHEKCEQEMVAAVEKAKTNGASQDEIDDIINKWQTQQATAKQQSEVARVGQKQALENKLKALKDSRLSKERQHLEQHKNLELNHLVTDQTLKSAETLQQVESLTLEQNNEADHILSVNADKISTDVNREAEKLERPSDKLNEDQFIKTLEASELFKIVRSLHGATSGFYDFARVNDQMVITDKLDPVPIDNLSPQEKIVYNFCQFMLGLITDKCELRPVTLLVATTVPYVPEITKNAFMGMFSYDATNRFLYIWRPKLAEKNPGNLYVMIAHCAAHIKVGDLSNDYNPYFRAQFYNILAKISEYIFTARINPSISLPPEYNETSNKIQDCFKIYFNIVKIFS